MSLNRYSNREDIISTNGRVVANKFPEGTGDVILKPVLEGLPTLGGDELQLHPEAHLYIKVEDNRLISSIPEIKYQMFPPVVEGAQAQLDIDLTEVAQRSEVPAGKYHMVVNLFARIIWLLYLVPL